MKTNLCSRILLGLCILLMASLACLVLDYMMFPAQFARMSILSMFLKLGSFTLVLTTAIIAILACRELVLRWRYMCDVTLDQMLRWE